MQLNGNAPSLGRDLLTESTQIHVNWRNSMADLGFSILSTGKQSGMKWRLDDAPSYASNVVRLVPTYFPQRLVHFAWIHGRT